MTTHRLLGRIDRAVVALLSLVGLSAALFVALPAALDRSSVEILDRELTSASIDRTGVRLETVVELTELEAEQPFSSDLSSSFPNSHQPVGAIHQWLEMPALNVREVNGSRPSFGISVVVRAHEDLDSLAVVVDQIPETTDANVIDIAVTQETATAMDALLGDEFSVTLDTTDPLPSAYPVHFDPAVLRVQRIVELVPVDDDVWFGDDRLHRARQADTPDGFEVTAYAAIEPRALVQSQWGDRPGSLVRRVDAAALPRSPSSVEEAESWQLELSRLAAASAGPTAIGETVPVTRLPVLLDDIARGRRDAQRVITTLLAALLAVLTLAAIGLARHAALARRDTLAVVRSRGASSRQLAMSSLLVGAVGGVVASTVGVAAAGVGLAATSGATLGLFPIVTAVGAATTGTAGVVAAVVVSQSRRDLAGELSNAPLPPSPAARAVDILLVIVSISGTAVVVQRDPVASSIDLVGIVTIASLTLTVGMLARRLVGLTGWALGFVPLPDVVLAADLGRRHLQTSTTRPGLVEVAATAVVVLAATGSLLQSDQDRVVDDSWEATGAEVRIDAALGEAFDVDTFAGVPGIEAVALEARLQSLVAVEDITPSRVDIIAIDHAEVIRVTRDDPQQPFGDDALDAVRDDGSIPALVPAEGLGRGPIPVGAAIRSVTQVDPLRFTVVGTHRVRQLDGPAIVVDRTLVDQVLGRDLDARSAWLAGTVDAQTLAALDPVGRVRDRAEVESTLQSDPQRQTVRLGTAVIAAAAMTAALMATVFATWLAVGLRRRQSAILSAVGASRNTARAAIAVEVLLGFAVAVAAGVAGAVFVLPVLERMLPDGERSLPLATNLLGIGLGSLTVVGMLSVFVLSGQNRVSQQLRGGGE